ncbi:hypothetical protein LCL85_08495 [Vibrio alginolyticus]|nr:hypothetical protein [Vibrio alginolyticus]
MINLTNLLGETWAITTIWFSGTFAIIKVIRTVTVNLENSGDFSIQGRNVLKNNLRTIVDEDKTHWFKDFSLVTNWVFGSKLISFKSFVISALISTFLYFFILIILYELPQKHQPIVIVGRESEYDKLIIYILPIVNIFCDYLSLILTRFIISVKKISIQYRLVIDTVCSLALVIISINIFVFSFPIILEQMSNNGLDNKTIAEWLYDANIKIENSEEGRVVEFKSEGFNYRTAEKDGVFYGIEISYNGPGWDGPENFEIMDKKTKQAHKAINIALLDSYILKNKFRESSFFSLSLVIILLTSLSTSLWLWLHTLSVFTMSILRKSTRNFRLLNIDNKPLQIIGIITCTYLFVISVCTYLFIVVI